MGLRIIAPTARIIPRITPVIEMLSLEFSHAHIRDEESYDSTRRAIPCKTPQIPCSALINSLFGAN